MKKHDLKNTAAKFLFGEEGSATPLAIGFCVIFIVVGGLAVDFNKAMSERTQMQMAADSAAQSALYSREFQSVDDAKASALATIGHMLPDVAYAGALTKDDIEFGVWDEATGAFTADPNSRTAVRVFAELEPERNNASRNILLGMIGRDTFTIRVNSIYGYYYPPCMTEGFVAEDVVDLQSNNSYTDGFCIHSNTYVSINQNNYFEPGTVVSMPNLNDLDIAASGFEKNEGLQTALREGKYIMRLLNQMDRRFESLRAGEALYTQEVGITAQADVLWPLDISGGSGGNGSNGKGNGKDSGGTTEPTATDTETTAEPTSYDRFSMTDTGKKTLTPAAFDVPQRIYRLQCSGNGDITFSADTFADFVLVTNCPVSFSNGTILEDVIIATEGDVNASHVQIGRDDNCAAGGGAGIWTYGDVKTASALSGYGAQIIAKGDIQFTANASGIEGVSFVAGGRIDGTSNSSMGYCDEKGTEGFQSAPYFRMLN